MVLNFGVIAQTHHAPGAHHAPPSPKVDVSESVSQRAYRAGTRVFLATLWQCPNPWRGLNLGP